MKQLLKIYKDRDDIDFEKIWNEGYFAFDTNVLLDLYRIPREAQKDLIKIFENKQFNKRMFLPFQSLLEFLNNRQGVIVDQNIQFDQVDKLIINAIDDYHQLMKKLQDQLLALKLDKRHNSIQPNKFINTENLEEGISFLKKFQISLKEQKKEQKDINYKDEIKDQVLSIFENKILSPLEKSTLEEIYSEGEKRYKNETPPGYKDSSKIGSYYHLDKEYKRKYGDLLLWKEIINETNIKKFKYVVLVTGDAKEDWLEEIKGRKIGPKKELLNEIYMNAPDLEVFYMYNTFSFLENAKNYLDNSINDSSIVDLKAFYTLSDIAQYEEHAFELSQDAKKLIQVLKQCEDGQQDMYDQNDKVIQLNIILGKLTEIHSSYIKIKNKPLHPLFNDILNQLNYITSLCGQIAYMEARMKRSTTEEYLELNKKISQFEIDLANYEFDTLFNTII